MYICTPSVLPTSVALVEKAAHAGRGHESPFGLASASLSGYHAHLARLKVVKVACVHETVGQIGPRRHSRVH
jgi:hypothetical protein